MSEVQGLLDLTDNAPPPLLLRPYQEEALAAIRAAWAAGVSRQLLVLPTGAGKTVVFAHLVKEMGQRALILAHRDELIEQAVSKLRAVLGHAASIGVVKAERNEIGAKVLVGSIQTVSGGKRLAQLPSDLGLVIVDEAHHSAAETYRRVLRALGCLDPDGPLLLGVTATPDRGDGQRIGKDIFEAPVYQRVMRDLIKDGYLCEVANRHVYIDVDFANLKTSHGDFDLDELERKLAQAGAVGAIINAYREYGEGRKTLAFLPGVALAHALAHAARDAGIAAEALDGSMPQETRRGVLERFAAGHTRFLANCMVLTEGFDEPSIECLVMCRPTKSRPLFVQMLGRGMRLYPGKRNCLVLDVTGISSTHNVVTIPDVFGDDDGPEAPQVDPDDDGEEGEEETGSRPPQLRVLTGGKLRQVAVDLFAAQAIVPKLHHLHLVPVQGAATEYVALDLGDGLLKIGPHPRGGYCVIYNGPGAVPALLHRDAEGKGALEYAYGYAYQFGKPWAYKRGLRWRAKPATPRAIETVRRLGLVVSAVPSAGEVADAFLALHCVRGYGEAGVMQRGANV